MLWIVECVVITLIVIAVAVKFYNIGYNECADDLKDTEEKENESNNRNGKTDDV